MDQEYRNHDCIKNSRMKFLGEFATSIISKCVFADMVIDKLYCCIKLIFKTLNICRTNPLNAGKKKEEALSMLKKWFPQMENFSGQLKKYKVTINDLLAENEKLEARARASESGKIKDRMERAKLESELHDMQRLVDRIPPDILAELKRQQRQYGKER